MRDQTLIGIHHEGRVVVVYTTLATRSIRQQQEYQERNSSIRRMKHNVLS